MKVPLTAAPPIAPNALPEPIADLYLAYEYERRRPAADSMRVFHRMMDTFEGCLALGALVAACDTVQTDTAGHAPHDGVDTLRRSQAASIGVWWHILKQCLHDHSPQQLFAPPLLMLVHRHTGLGHLLDNIPGLRNRMRGHTFTLPTGMYTAAVEKHADLLQATVAVFAAPHMPPLARVMAHDADDTFVELRMGSNLRHEVRRLRLAKPADVGECILLGVPNENLVPHLGLHPFIVQRTVHEEAGLDQLALYQGRQNRHALYLPTRVPERFQIPDGAAAVEARLHMDRRVSKQIRERTSADRKLRVGDVLDEAHRHAQAFLATARRERVYMPEAYVERPRLDPVLRAWQMATPSLLLVAGAAGSGKSSLLCRILERWQGPTRGDIILPRSAATLPATAPALAEEIARNLSLADGLDIGMQRWRESHPDGARNVMLLVDGIDRADDPAALIAACDGIVARGVHVLATIAGPVLDGLANGDVIRSLANRHMVGLDNIALRLTPLDTGETADAYDRYRTLAGTAPLTPLYQVPRELRAAMSNPLLLRVTCEVFDGVAIPPETTEADVLVAHARRTVFADPSRQDFTRRLVHILAERKVRRVGVSRLLTDNSMRAGVLESDGPYRALVRELVLVEHAGRTSRLGLAPEVYVEFTFDAMLGYLLLVEATESADTPLLDIVLAMLPYADTFTPNAVAVDFAVRVASHDERIAILGAMMTPTGGTAGTKAVARALIWLEHVAPVRVQDIARRRLDDARCSDGYVDLEVVRQMLEALDMDVEPIDTSDPSGAAGEAWKRIVETRTSNDALLGVLHALVERQAMGLAGACADIVLQRRRDDLSYREERDVVLVLAEAFIAEGTRPSLHAARDLTRPYIEGPGAGRDPATTRRATLLYARAARNCGDRETASASLAGWRADTSAVAASDRLEVVYELALCEDHDGEGFRAMLEEAIRLQTVSIDAMSTCRVSQLKAIAAKRSDSEDAWEHALLAARAAGNPHAVAECLLVLAQWKQDFDTTAAEKLVQEALRISADNHMAQILLMARSVCANLRSIVGDTRGAHEQSRNTMRASLALGDLHQALNELSNLGTDAFHEVGIATMKRGIDLKRLARQAVAHLPIPAEIRESMQRELSLEIAVKWIIAGDLQSAERELASSSEISELEGDDCCDLAEVRVRLALQRGDAGQAVAMARAACAETAASDETRPSERRRAAILYADACVAAGCPRDALSLIEEAWKITASDALSTAALGLATAKARLHLAAGAYADAHTWSSRAVDISDKKSSAVGAFRPYTLLYQVLMAEAHGTADPSRRLALHREANRVLNVAHGLLVVEAKHRGDPRLEALWLCQDPDARLVRTVLCRSQEDDANLAAHSP
jgi:hypothetical protein